MIGRFFSSHPWAKTAVTSQPPTAFCSEFSDLLVWDSNTGGGIRTTTAAQLLPLVSGGSGDSISGGGGSSRGGLIVVDFTALSEGAIHNRFDKNAVNDVDSKRTLQKKIEADYEKYSKDAAMLLAGTVRVTSDADWKELVRWHIFFVSCRETRALLGAAVLPPLPLHLIMSSLDLSQG